MKYRIIKNEGFIQEKDSGIETLGLKIGDEVEGKQLAGSAVLCTIEGKKPQAVYSWNLLKT